MKNYCITYIEDDTCPECGTKITAASAVDGSDVGPVFGDISICFECTSYLKYDDNIKLQKMTVEDIIGLENEDLLILTNERKNIKAFKKWKESQNNQE